MITKKFIVNEPNGLHARPAMKLADQCQQFNSKVIICNGCQKADGCSIIELLLLGAKEGASLDVIIQGIDEAEVEKKLDSFFDSGEGI